MIKNLDKKLIKHNSCFFSADPQFVMEGYDFFIFVGSDPTLKVRKRESFVGCNVKDGREACLAYQREGLPPLKKEGKNIEKRFIGLLLMSKRRS